LRTIERLDFDDRQAFDEEIGTTGACDVHAFEHERQRLRWLEPEARAREQHTEAGEAGALQRARTEPAVLLNLLPDLPQATMIAVTVVR
jgi:hypothetical protein